MLFTPSPVTNCYTFSDPLERDVLYGRPIHMWYSSSALATNTRRFLTIALVAEWDGNGEVGKWKDINFWVHQKETQYTETELPK